MPELTALFVHSRSIGYGRMGVETVDALRASGVDVYDRLDDPTADQAMEHLNDGRTSKLTNTVCWFSVPTHATGWWKGQHPVIFTMWEANILPESFRENLHEFAQVIVPSTQNLGLFSQYHDDVSYVPLGIDPVRWGYREPTPPGMFFNFLVCGSGPRKGTDLAYKAFRKVFQTWPSDGPIPRLLMKSPRGEEVGGNVEVIAGRISDEAEVDLYASAHCVLAPARGEGFGLQPLQAIALGRPTILTNAHGHESFAHLGFGLDSTLKESAYFVYGPAGEWWEPDFDQLCQQMEWMYHHWEEASADAAENSKKALEEFTWAKTAEKFCAALGDELDRPYQGPQEWYRPTAQLFRVRVNKAWRADIGGTTYIFEPGVDYYRPADVKRILFEADLLDPECLNDPGLAPEQLERVEGYRSRHSVCPTCRQAVA